MATKKISDYHAGLDAINVAKTNYLIVQDTSGNDARLHIDSLSDSISDTLETEIAANTAAISTAQTDIKTNAANIATNAASVSDLTTRVATLEAGSGEVTDDVARWSGDAAMYAYMKNTWKPTSLLSAFQNCKWLKVAPYMWTDNVTDMRSLFYGCSNLIEAHGFSSTEKVTNMSGTFRACPSLVSIEGVESLDVSSVTEFGYMFNGCSALPSLDLSAWNMSSAKSLVQMFNGCSALTSLDVSTWDVSTVTNMQWVFMDCSGLTSLDVSAWDVSNVTTVEYLFRSMTSLKTLDLSTWDLSSVTVMWNMFDGDSALENLTLGPKFFAFTDTAATSNASPFGLNSLTKWTNDTMVTSLVTNLYDRATNGLATYTLRLSTQTKAALTDEQKASITSKGYIIA